MNFRDWLAETGTSTGDVAIFSRPMGSVNRRMYPPSITFGEEGNKKKKKKKSSFRITKNRFFRLPTKNHCRKAVVLFF